MQTRSYRFGELKRRIQESASEFKPVFGNGVRSKEKEFNRQANKDIEKETKAYNGGIKINKPKNNGESVLAQVNKGLTDLQYDGEVSKEFKNRVNANLRGYSSDLEMKNHAKEPKGNATYNDAIAKELERMSVAVKQMHDANSEIGITNGQKKKEDTHLHDTTIGESKKINLLRFKKVQFISEAHMLRHVPDEYKTEGKKFYMQDCEGNKYLVEWHKKPEVAKMLNESYHLAEMDRIKYLFDYNGKNQKTTNASRMNEDKRIDDMLGHVRELMK